MHKSLCSLSLPLLVALLMLYPVTATAGLIANGDFETGNLNGWTVSGAMQYYGVIHSAAHTGSWGIYFGDVVGLTYISQTIPTTPGGSYQFSFFVSNHVDPGAAPADRGEFWWDGNLIDSATDVGSFAWQQNSYVLTATTSATEVKFGFDNPPGYWFLDDVAATATPEPATTLFCGLGLLVVITLRRRIRMG